MSQVDLEKQKAKILENKSSKKHFKLSYFEDQEQRFSPDKDQVNSNNFNGV
jgi:hypothetical protein